jgi:hypothetical protein
MHYWIIGGLMVIAAATYCVVFGFGVVYLPWACIRRMSQKIAASRRRKVVEAHRIEEKGMQQKTTPSRN